MLIEKNYNLIKDNTFRVPAVAKYFVEVKSEEDLKELSKTKEFKENPKLILGGGSNVLFTRDWPGIVILNKIKGIKVIEEENDFVWIRAMSGEVWHDLVNFAVVKGFWGIENLSFIPGSVGGAPMQNIGAYGGELKTALENVEVLDLETGEKKIFDANKLELGYRDSIFKNSAKGRYFILAITLKLSKKEKKNLGYKILQDYLEKNNITVTKSKDVSDAVMAIRKSKLPDPREIGNAGSFFKNVFVDDKKLAELLKQYPEIPRFIEDKVNKIPAAWFVEQCGWKGKRVGDIGVHDKQALVLVNYGGGTGSEIKKFAEEIMNSVEQKFGIKLVPEVNLI